LRSDADYAAEFRQALEEAVRLRLRADVAVGRYPAAACNFGAATPLVVPSTFPELIPTATRKDIGWAGS